MSERPDPMLYALVGIAVGAVAVFIAMQTLQLPATLRVGKNTITELTRDSNGHVIGIFERNV